MVVAKFEQLSVADAVERSLRNAAHLLARDSALVATLRLLAERIDVLAASGFIDENGKLDNVSVPTFHKICITLGLHPPKIEGPTGGKVADPVSKLQEDNGRRRG